jgi:Sec-independent protein translocase protein TatA
MAKRKVAFVSSPVTCLRYTGTGAVSHPRIGATFALAERCRPRSEWFGKHLKLGIRSPPRMKWMAFLGGGGILGVGPSEMAVIMAVGWFLLGPTKLFSLSRDIGKVIGDIRRSANEAKTTFTDAMEIEVAAAEAKRLAAESGNENRDEQDENAEVQGEAELQKALAVDDAESTDVDEEVSEAFREVALSSAKGPAPLGELSVANRTAEASRFPNQEFGGLDLRDNDQGASEDILSRKRFLDQLQRASDPEQVPDLDVEGDSLEAAEEDVEVARLEYELAKARLAAKQKREKTTSELVGHDPTTEGRSSM